MSDSVDRLNIELRDHTVLVRGELDALLAQQLTAVLGPRLGGYTTQLDLRDVTFIDSSGLAAVLSAHRCAEQLGGILRVLPSARVRRLFEIAGLGGHLHVDER